MKNYKVELKPHSGSFWKNVFGDKLFIKQLFKLFVPAALQSLIAIAVLYVDNFSLALLIKDPIEATSAKEALGLASPIMNAVVLISIGWIGGIGVMVSQYYGNKEVSMVKSTVAFRLWTTLLLQLPFIILMATIPKELISLSSNVSSGKSWELAENYLFFSAFTYIPFAVAYALSFSLQETKRPLFSFVAALIGMATNVILDPIAIIFSPNTETAVMWVALSTGLARIVQCLVVIIYIVVKKDSFLWFFKSWFISIAHVSKIFKNGITVFVNDATFAVANMFLNICLLTYNPGIHDATTNLMLIIQFTSVIWPGMSSASAILVGSELGAGRLEQAKYNSRHLLSWGVVISTALGILLFIVAIFVNEILSPSASTETNTLSRNLEWLMAPFIVSQGISAIIYFSVRSGGSKIILLTDCFVMVIWVILMATLTYTKTTANWNPLLYVFLLEFNQIMRMILSLIIYKWFKWAKVLTKQEVVALELLGEQNPGTYGRTL